MSMINKTYATLHMPFLLQPVGKNYLWGGTKLKDEFSKELNVVPLAETWECSTHPDGLSVVASGAFSGLTLREVLRKHPEFVGTHPNGGEDLPILIKLIDAKKDLSVQVHPDDQYAREHENGSQGKSEMWYVLSAEEDAKLVYGFYRDMDSETVRKSIQNGKIEKYLQRVSAKEDDVFFIPSGTVHAIGAGIVIAEIQQNSNLTYRLYDYGRLDTKGHPRELHVDKALDVADLSASLEPRQPMRVLHFRQGQATELLTRCRYFRVERMLLNTERTRKLAQLKTGSNSFQVLLCTKGCGVLFWRNNLENHDGCSSAEQAQMLNFFKGDCIFVPADSVVLRIHGKAQFLKVEC